MLNARSYLAPIACFAVIGCARGCDLENFRPFRVDRSTDRVFSFFPNAAVWERSALGAGVILKEHGYARHTPLPFGFGAADPSGRGPDYDCS